MSSGAVVGMVAGHVNASCISLSRLSALSVPQLQSVLSAIAQGARCSWPRVDITVLECHNLLRLTDEEVMMICTYFNSLR